VSTIQPQWLSKNAPQAPLKKNKNIILQTLKTKTSNGQHKDPSSLFANFKYEDQDVSHEVFVVDTGIPNVDGLIGIDMFFTLNVSIDINNKKFRFNYDDLFSTINMMALYSEKNQQNVFTFREPSINNASFINNDEKSDTNNGASFINNDEKSDTNNSASFINNDEASNVNSVKNQNKEMQLAFEKKNNSEMDLNDDLFQRRVFLI
jgi:hypothetical protein